MKKIFVILLFAIISTSLYSQRRGWVPWQMKLYFLDSIYFVKEPLIGLDTAATRGFVRSLSGTGSMVYPDAGIALSSGGAWGSSITNNSANWNTAYGWGDHSIAGYAPLDSPTFTGTVTLPSGTAASTNDINDTITARLAGGTVAVALADSNAYEPYNYATPSFVRDYVGSGGGSLTGKRLQFIVDVTTGAPTSGDTLVVHSSFTNKHVDVYRDGAKQYKNTTTTNTVSGYRLPSGHDTIFVNPAFRANEQIIVDMLEPINWEFIAVEGQESGLLAKLAAYYPCDEPEGTSTLIDAQGVQDGSVLGTNPSGHPGKYYHGKLLEYTKSIRISNNTNLNPKGTAYTIACWVNVDTLPSVTGRSGYLFQANNSAAPTNPHYFHIRTSDNKVYWSTRNSTSDVFTALSTSAISADTWTHVAVVAEIGSAMKIYINGVEEATSAGTPTGTFLEGSSTMYFGNSYTGANANVRGYMDELAVSQSALSEAEIQELMAATYPFL